MPSRDLAECTCQAARSCQGRDEKVTMETLQEVFPPTTSRFLCLCHPLRGETCIAISLPFFIPGKSYSSEEKLLVNGVGEAQRSLDRETAVKCWGFQQTSGAVTHAPGHSSPAGGRSPYSPITLYHTSCPLLPLHPQTAWCMCKTRQSRSCYS